MVVVVVESDENCDPAILEQLPGCGLVPCCSDSENSVVIVMGDGTLRWKCVVEGVVGVC